MRRSTVHRRQRRDPTMLEVYLAVGRAYTDWSSMGGAVALETYVAYNQKTTRLGLSCREQWRQCQPSSYQFANRRLTQERYALAYLARPMHTWSRRGQNALDDLLSAAATGGDLRQSLPLGRPTYQSATTGGLKWINLSISETAAASDGLRTVCPARCSTRAWIPHKPKMQSSTGAGFSF